MSEDITLDEVARRLAEHHPPLSLYYLAGALTELADQKLSGLTPEQFWLAKRGIVPPEGWKRS
jgi:hypothetical protein